MEDDEVSNSDPVTIENVIVDKVKNDDSDIQSEIEYWNSSIIYYVIGANLPSYVMEGFIRRIWRNMGVYKFVVLKKGVFIVRFCTME